MLSKDYVEYRLRDGGYIEVFKLAIRQAREDWYRVIANSPNEMGGAIARESANFFNRRVIELICVELESDPNTVITDANQTKIFTFYGEINLRCKKLNRQMRAMNIKTHRAAGIWYYNQQPLPGAFRDWINVTFGWQPNHLGIIDTLAIIFEFQDTLQWVIELSEDGEEKNIPLQLPLPTPASDQVYTISIRNTERAQRIAEDEIENNLKDEAT